MKKKSFSLLTMDIQRAESEIAFMKSPERAELLKEFQSIPAEPKTGKKYGFWAFVADLFNFSL